MSFVFSKEVQDNLKSNQSIVALESTVITHGLPQPANLELAFKLEALIQEQGAIPATLALIDGQIHIGLDEEQLHKLATAPNTKKVSSRDIAAAVVQGSSGGTTVAATLRLAEAAGIQVFATGGIGGVHRGSDWDVSADLLELSQRAVICVCAGAKAILDLPATLEQFETLGVPVLGYQTDQFPAFYSRQSGLPVSMTVNDLDEVAAFAKAHWELGGKGILLTNPIPVKDEIPSTRVEAWINIALTDLDREDIHGPASTPFLLKRLGEISGGETLKSNLALLENNAKLAAQLAPILK